MERAWRDGGDGAVVVHRVALDRPAGEVAALRATLAADERARAAAYGTPDAARAFVVARAALRDLLGRALNLDPAAVPLAVGEHDRPYVAGGPRGLDFNVAHSGGWALVAVARGGRVGADVERLRPVDARAISRRLFTPAEAAELAALDGDERMAAFFAMWTVKEACLKAAGTGLRGGLASVEVRDPGWSVHPASPAPGYAGALATDVPGPVGYRTWGP